MEKSLVVFFFLFLFFSLVLSFVFLSSSFFRSCFPFVPLVLVLVLFLLRLFQSLFFTDSSLPNLPYSLLLLSFLLVKLLHQFSFFHSNFYFFLDTSWLLSLSLFFTLSSYLLIVQVLTHKTSPIFISHIISLTTTMTSDLSSNRGRYQGRLCHLLSFSITTTLLSGPRFTHHFVRNLGHFSSLLRHRGALREAADVLVAPRDSHITHSITRKTRILTFFPHTSGKRGVTGHAA